MTRLRIRQWILAAGVATMIAAPGLPVGAQDAVTLSPAEMEKAAKLSLETGYFERAETFAAALLTRDETDVVAHLIRSRALRLMGELEPARKAARAGWSHAETDEERYAAALLMAQALSSQDKRTRAQFWLRRAAQHAPSEAHKAKAAQDFRYVQRRNPWSTYLSFTLAPNSNINNGSARESLEIENELYDVLAGGPVTVPIDDTSRALSGIEIGGQLQTRYRFAQTETTAHDLRATLSYRTFRLSDSAERDAPDVSGSDYAYGTVSVGYGFKRLRADRRGEFGLTTDIGQAFYAGSRYNSFVRAGVSQTYYTDRRTKLRFGAVAEAENGQAVSDTESLLLSLSRDRQMRSGNGLHLGVTVKRQISDNPVHDYAETRLRSGLVLGKRVMGVRWRFGAGVAFRDYEESFFDPSGRQDTRLELDATATFEQIDYYGFSPTVSVRASKTNSNVALYDVNRFGVSLGIVSKF
ncbi:surface lipoprotein assembly modifier [Sulfitobacter sp. S190]|uniref:surface lipoprotein assembly modifier n=1 Tax=Sulfitobacter sp. S190 TaxID=2867022 RepID=UPI0021A51E47|nr:surface lipoprotein assembly modifier [Sulfitobacter sp. S190]UWR21477.1 surface lipoprotein assembly modifier [Sulfitobacter sp. S190]